MLLIFIVILIASEINCLESENEIKKVLMNRTQIELSKLKIETASPKLIKMIEDASKAEDK
jgi:hypothetical protein